MLLLFRLRESLYNVGTFEQDQMRQSVKKSRSKCQNKEIMNINNQFLNF